MDGSSEPLHETRVRHCLEQVVSSPMFVGSPMLVRFLRFVVDETLHGRADTLKEYTIGVGALGKPPTFDPANDSTVRVAARQLRFKLSEYAASLGDGDDGVIELPKGRYVPVFVFRAAPPADGRMVTPPSPPVTNAQVRSQSPMQPWLIVGIAGVLIFAVVALLLPSRRGTPASARTARHPVSPPQLVATRDTPRTATIVVLPFLNLSGLLADEFMADGIADEITTTLARSAHLRIVARTSAFKYKRTTKDVRTIAAELGANAVLEGSVRRTRNQYRVSVKLIDAIEGVSVWAETFTVDRRDLFTVYDDVAQAVADETNRRLHINAREPSRRVALRDPQAHILYLEARYHWNKRAPASIERSVVLYQQAIARDSTYALAYAGLADSYATMAVNSVSAPGVSPPKAVAAARRAIALDPTLGEPHAALALMRAFQDYDWAGADREFATAIRLSPNYATAYSWYAITLLARARFDETLAQLEMAQRLDPLSLAIGYNIAETLYYARRWNDAERKAARLLALDSTFTPAHVLLGKIYALSGRTVLARAAFLRSKDSVSMVQYETGPEHDTKLRAAMRRLPADVVQRYPAWIGTLYASMSENDSAFLWLDRAYQARHLDLVSARVDPGLDNIRRDARYPRLLRRLGLNE
jgi:TolB-like protein/Flp pilus assembly protein TadD